jgi:hypothetical protein
MPACSVLATYVAWAYVAALHQEMPRITALAFAITSSSGEAGPKPLTGFKYTQVVFGAFTGATFASAGIIMGSASPWQIYTVSPSSELGRGASALIVTGSAIPLGLRALYDLSFSTTVVIGVGTVVVVGVGVVVLVGVGVAVGVLQPVTSIAAIVTTANTKITSRLLFKNASFKIFVVDGMRLENTE